MRRDKKQDQKTRRDETGAQKDKPKDKTRSQDETRQKSRRDETIDETRKQDEMRKQDETRQKTRREHKTRDKRGDESRPAKRIMLRHNSEPDEYCSSIPHNTMSITEDSVCAAFLDFHSNIRTGAQLLSFKHGFQILLESRYRK